MEPIPLTLSILRLTPNTLIPLSHLPDHTPLEDVPLNPDPHPSLPSSFSLSPTHNYPAPFGTMTLGSSLAVKLQLVSNPPSSPRPDSNAGDIGDVGMNEMDGVREVPGVKGVKMMLEVQGPGGRWRLGEIIHGEEGKVDGQDEVEGDIEPAGAEIEDKEMEIEEKEEEDGVEKVSILPPGEFVEMDVSAEMKELGLQVLICSVAWETSNGRKTFQRFFKFNVVAPLSIKTKIHPSQTPMAQLDPERRNDVYLEVLMQNVSTESILFDKVNLEPVFGMTAKSITPSSLFTSPPSSATEDETPAQSDVLGSLHPGDTRQHLFLLHPQPPPTTKSRQSVFGPTFIPGTILPLGRLDMAWLAGSHRERGRLQTSTLNRRIAAAPVAPLLTSTPTRKRAASPMPGQVPGTPGREARDLEGERKDEAEKDEWEYDLAVLELDRGGMELDETFSAKLRVGIRSTNVFSRTEGESSIDEIPPKPLRIGIQYLTPPASTEVLTTPSLTLSPPTNPAISSLNASAGPSRPMTPISSQLRHASQTILNSRTSPINTLDLNTLQPGGGTGTFPPEPILQRPAPPPKSTSRAEGEVFPLGQSLILPEPKSFELAQEQYSTTYADSSEPPERWEVTYKVEMRFMAIKEGMAKLGGIRLLVIGDESGLEGKVLAEWETLGDLWISS